MKLFDDDYVTLSLDEGVPCLEWIGKGFMPSEAFRASEEKSLQFYLQYKGKYPRLEWFVDVRNIGPISPQDTQWAADEILPKFVTAGLTKEAFVVPTSSVVRLVVKNYASQAGKRVRIRAFETAGEAKLWLGVTTTKLVHKPLEL